MSNLSDLLNGINEEAKQADDGAEERRSDQQSRFVFFQQNTGVAETDYQPPVPPATKTLRGFQRNAIQLALNARRLILGWAPGMGKTLPAMAVAAAEAEQGRKTIFVSPPALLTQLTRAFAEDFSDVKVSVLRGRKNVTLDGKKLAPNFDDEGKLAGYDLPSDLDVIVIGDAVLMDRSDDLKAWGADSLIFDEAQRFQTPSTGRSRALHDIANQIDDDGIVMGLTGTLVKGNAGAVYSPVAALGDYVATKLSGAASLPAFQRAWLTCVDTRFGKFGITTEQAHALNRRLRETCYDYHRPEDVLDLPVNNVVTMGVDVEENDLKTYRQIETDFINWVIEQKGMAAAERASKALALVQLNKLREEAGNCKVEPAADQAQDLVESGELVVMMADHTSVVEGLASKLASTKIVDADGNSRNIRVGKFYGKQSRKQNDADMDGFKAGDLDVLVVNFKSGGEGLNLQEAKNLIFVEIPWTPGEFAQCARRIIRANSIEVHGRDAVCTIKVVNGAWDRSIDVRLWERLDAKAAITDILNSGEQDVTLDGASVFDEVLDDYGWFD